MMDRRRFLGAGLAGAVALGLPTAALAKIVAGKDYTLVSPAQPTEVAAGKIEVLEFFWYGCPHCFDLEPTLKKWVPKLPKDVEFRRLPTIFRESWVPGARVYYALESIGELERMHGQVFDAVHVDRVNPGDDRALTEWIVKKGVDRKKFTDAYGSFAVQTKARRAQQLTQAYKIQGVPALAVEGRYVTSVSLTGSQDALTATLDELIVLARSEKARK